MGIGGHGISLNRSITPRVSDGYLCRCLTRLVNSTAGVGWVSVLTSLVKHP